MLAIRVDPEYRSITRSLSRWGAKEESNALIAAESEVADLMIGLIYDSYRRWERGRRFLEVVEVDLTIGLIHDSYRR
jgi:hypothetical protein